MQPKGPCDVRRDLFGGRGEVRVWDLLRGRPAPPFSAALACELAPGGRVGRHTQQQDAELVVFTEGTGSVEVDGTAVRVESGSVVWLPLGSTLAIEANGEAPLRYLIVKAPEPG